ncbi:hypothetical protein B0T24DRAFT_619057 [Lasiosphaeria ovina]|uniref:Uncharacterized protein n=1 Tax=Lasiosphaeria ovina TaxID=92902 RepID=A0AAE0NAY8_9PEZI|nr:hypothetical protein B0T24DRAFT_619057 [Lasiosphaeria ovina]
MSVYLRRSVRLFISIYPVTAEEGCCVQYVCCFVYGGIWDGIGWDGMGWDIGGKKAGNGGDVTGLPCLVGGFFFSFLFCFCPSRRMMSMPSVNVHADIPRMSNARNIYIELASVWDAADDVDGARTG